LIAVAEATIILCTFEGNGNDVNVNAIVTSTALLQEVKVWVVEHFVKTNKH
jgi:hypothetical protein